MTDQKNKPAGGLKKALLLFLVEKAGNIITGWLRAKKLKKTDAKMKALSATRLAICEKCSHAKYNKLIHILNGEAQQVNTMVCELCHCPVLEKSLVKGEYCPIHKW